MEMIQEVGIHWECRGKVQNFRQDCPWEAYEGRRDTELWWEWRHFIQSEERRGRHCRMWVALYVLGSGKESVRLWQILFSFSDEWRKVTSWQCDVGKKRCKDLRWEKKLQNKSFWKVEMLGKWCKAEQQYQVPTCDSKSWFLRWKQPSANLFFSPQMCSSWNVGKNR